MKRLDSVQNKIVSLDDLKRQVSRWRLTSQKIVFTNGCFDLLHAGHIHALSASADLGQKLVVGINTDKSVSKLKQGRPIQNQQSRALVLASVYCVDAVVLFDEDTPEEIIKTIKPDVLTKGGDYKISQIAGADDVLANGGQVIIIPLLPDQSTSLIEEKIKRGI